MCKLAHVIRYTVPSQNFNVLLFYALTYTTVKLSAVFVYLSVYYNLIHCSTVESICAFWLSCVVWNLCTFSLSTAWHTFGKISSFSIDYYERNTTVSDQIRLLWLNNNLTIRFREPQRSVHFCQIVTCAT